MLTKLFRKAIWHVKIRTPLLGMYTEKPASMSKQKSMSGYYSRICSSNKAQQNNTNQLLCPSTEEQQTTVSHSTEF